MSLISTPKQKKCVHSAETAQTVQTTYYYFCMDDYDQIAIHLKTVTAPTNGSITFTVEATWQRDGTAPDACNYVDVTNMYFGVASWDGVGGGGAVESSVLVNCITAKYMRVKLIVVDEDPNNDAAWEFYVDQKRAA